jgi:hypothetical protein
LGRASEHKAAIKVEQASSGLVLKRYILAQPIKVIDPPARCSEAGRKTLLYLFKSTPKKGIEKHPEKSAFSSRLRGNWNPPKKRSFFGGCESTVGYSLARYR